MIRSRIRSRILFSIVSSRGEAPSIPSTEQGWRAMSKFSLSKASGGKKTKRPAEAAASGPPNKIPKVSEITVEPGVKPSATPRRKPQIAPVQICIYKYTNDAGDSWATFKGDGVPLWQIQIDHNAQRSICFRLRESFEDYLRSANATNDSLPISLVDLEKVAGIRLVIGDQKDPEDVGFVQWRSVFYVAGDMNNFLLLLDVFFCVEGEVHRAVRARLG